MPPILDHNILPDMGRMTARLPCDASAGFSPGSERGIDCAPVIATLIQTTRLNNIDPQAWLAELFGHINDHAIHRIDELLPWV
jgi:hypothetical protein